MAQPARPDAAVVRRLPSGEEQGLITAVGDLRKQVAARIVGQRDAIDEILMALLAGGHALLVGVPGLAKTLMVRSVAAGSCQYPLHTLGPRTEAVRALLELAKRFVRSAEL